MENANWFILPVAAIVPLLLGVIWYHPQVFGTSLAKVTGQSIQQITDYSVKRIGFTYLFGLLMAYIVSTSKFFSWSHSWLRS